METLYDYVDKLLIILGHMPRQIIFPEDKKRAATSIKIIYDYINILEKLIDSATLKKDIQQLKTSHLSNYKELGVEMEEVISDTKKLLDDIKGTVAELKISLEKKPGKWEYSIRDLSQDMVMSRLHDEEGRLVIMKELALLNLNELEELITDPTHLQNLKDYKEIKKIEDEEQRVLQITLYFYKLIK